MFTFNFNVPTKLFFGGGALEHLKKFIKKTDRVLLVVGARHAIESGLVDRISDIIKESGADHVLFDGIRSNLPAEQVDLGSKIALEKKCTIVVGAGGGSVMDAARLIALAASHPGDFREYRVTGSKGIASITPDILPVLTIPTIPGTGGEMSPAALAIIDKRKEVFYSPYLFPKAAFVDPNLSAGAPPTLTAKVGVDAFVQGLEAFVSSAAQPFSDMFALKAMELTWKWLPQSVREPDDVESRAFMHLASITGFFAINQAGVGAIHALSDPLSARLGLHHGEALALLMPEVVIHNWDANPEKFTQVSILVNGKGDKFETARALRNWLNMIGLKEMRLQQLGVSISDILEMAKEAQNPDMQTNPKKLSEKEIQQIYESIW